MTIPLLVEGRDDYASSVTKQDKAAALKQIKKAAGELLDKYPNGTMPLDVQQEIIHAAAVIASEGEAVQMDIAANAAAGAPLNQTAVAKAFLNQAKPVREEAIRLARKFA